MPTCPRPTWPPCVARSPGVTTYECGITDGSAVDALVSAASELGPIDIVVNAIGVMAVGPFDGIADDEWHTTLDVNIVGPVRVMRAVIPAMSARGSCHVFNIGSVAGLAVGNAFTAPYAASKFALTAAAQAAAMHAAPHGGHVSLVVPTAVDTGFGRRVAVVTAGTGLSHRCGRSTATRP